MLLCLAHRALGLRADSDNDRVRWGLLSCSTGWIRLCSTVAGWNLMILVTRRRLCSLMHTVCVTLPFLTKPFQSLTRLRLRSFCARLYSPGGQACLSRPPSSDSGTVCGKAFVGPLCSNPPVNGVFSWPTQAHCGRVGCGWRRVLPHPSSAV